MTRTVLCLVLALTACWYDRTPPAAPPPAPPRPPSDPRAEVSDGDCIVFEAMNPRCKHTCLPGAPDTWPGCIEGRDRLVAQGYTCTSTHPRSCAKPVPPPPPPSQAQAPLVGRVLQVMVDGSDLVITIAAGSAHGVTPALRASLGTVPVTIVRVDKTTTTGKVAGTTVQQLQANPNVTFRP
jgi:hypothetical protein